jgi:hypothetical protein
MPYTSASSPEKRLINLAIFVMLLVSESGDIEIRPTPLYAELVPLARKLGRDAAQSAGNRAQKGRGPDFRGHGLKTTKMAERAGFEPAMEFNPHTRLAGECLQPLGHLSWNGAAEFRGCWTAWSEPRRACGDSASKRVCCAATPRRNFAKPSNVDGVAYVPRRPSPWRRISSNRRAKVCASPGQRADT